MQILPIKVYLFDKKRIYDTITTKAYTKIDGKEDHWHWKFSDGERIPLPMWMLTTKSDGVYKITKDDVMYHHSKIIAYNRINEANE